MVDPAMLISSSLAVLLWTNPATSGKIPKHDTVGYCFPKLCAAQSLNESKVICVSLQILLPNQFNQSKWF